MARTVCSRPSRPSRTAARAAVYPASKRRWKPSWRTVPASSTSRSEDSVPGRSMATGFSQKAGIPARAARPISSACAEVAAVITTASTPQAKTSCTPGAATASRRWARALARSGSASATTKAPTSRWRASVAAWNEPIRPVPMSPMRMVLT
ncbi:hypothetical protein DSC45_31545 [Streptomyces sp. YIM 130001]|nr:hypothetical protein DSC45_31545 [Streptomyces sp. YIM 130001]